jgi:rhodanese-related sulfurtransferase
VNRGGEPAKIALGLLKLTVPLRGKVGSAVQAQRIITYCGAGAAAASLANVLVRLGHPRVAIYDGGLLEWPSMPTTTDDACGPIMASC